MNQVLVPETRFRPALLGLLALALMTLYVMGMDQGQILSVLQGGVAFDQNLIHEALHDARHTAGLPCH